MYRLIYASKSSVDINPALMKNIITKAKENNEKAGVSGVLFYNFKYFLQCLEGGRHEVNGIFNRIARDERHQDLEVIVAREIDARMFSEWNMALVSAKDTNITSFYKYLPVAEFNPYLLSEKTAEGFIDSLRETATHLKVAA